MDYYVNWILHKTSADTFEQWKKLDDKYAVASLAFAGIIALWSSTGIISVSNGIPVQNTKIWK